MRSSFADRHIRAVVADDPEEDAVQFEEAEHGQIAIAGRCTVACGIRKSECQGWLNLEEGRLPAPNASQERYSQYNDTAHAVATKANRA